MMRLRIGRRFLLVLGSLALTYIAVVPGSLPVSSAEQEVYSLYFAPPQGSVSRRVERTTGIAGRWKATPSWFDACFPVRQPRLATLLAFHGANLHQGFIPRSFPPEADAEMSDTHSISARLGRALVEGAACIDGGNQHVQFSRVGFNPIEGEALLYVEDHCPMCGFGAFLLVTRVDGSWQVADKCILWVS